MVTSFLDNFKKLKRATRCAADSRKNSHNTQSNNLNVHSQVRMPTAQFSEKRKGDNKNLKKRRKESSKRDFNNRKGNVNTAIECVINKCIRGSRFDVKKNSKKSEYKLTIPQSNLGIETNSMELIAEVRKVGR